MSKIGTVSANSTAACPLSGRSSRELRRDTVDDAIEEITDLAAASTPAGPGDHQESDQRSGEDDECVFRCGLAEISPIGFEGLIHGSSQSFGSSQNDRSRRDRVPMSVGTITRTRNEGSTHTTSGSDNSIDNSFDELSSCRRRMAWAS